MKTSVVDKLYGFLKEEYADDNDFKFSHAFEESGFVESEIEDTLEIYKDYNTAIWLEMFANLGLYSYERFVHALLSKKETSIQSEELIRAVNYSYLTLSLGAKSCKCYKGHIGINMHRVSFILGLNILCSDEEMCSELGDHLLDSLNAKNCIIKRGREDALASWFVIELYSLVTQKEFHKKRARYPKDLSPYNMALEDWDSEDADMIDDIIGILCDKHLDKAIIPLDNYDFERKERLEIPSFQLFPYEILAWLKLREKAGLKNPTEFSHPLMNTTIAKMFLDIKEPLPKPKELPFAKELLEKLKEQCPDVEIPEWLEDMSQLNTIPEDFMNM
jgi:hypothetical protein